MSSKGTPGDVQRDLAKALLNLRQKWPEEPVTNESFRNAIGRLLNAGDKAVAELERLRKIAAHVPGRVYIVAKEAAGYGDVVRAKRPAPQHRGEQK